MLNIGEDELALDLDGWSESIRYIAFAIYQGPEQAEAALQGFEKLCRPEPSDPDLDCGVDDDVFEVLIESTDELVRKTLSSWEVVFPCEPRFLDEAMSETWKSAYLERTSLPPNAGEWILEKAARNLFQILESRPGAGPQIQKVEERPCFVISEDVVISELVSDVRERNVFATKASPVG